MNGQEEMRVVVKEIQGQEEMRVALKEMEGQGERERDGEHKEMRGHIQR